MQAADATQAQITDRAKNETARIILSEYRDKNLDSIISDSKAEMAKRKYNLDKLKMVTISSAIFIAPHEVRGTTVLAYKSRRMGIIDRILFYKGKPVSGEIFSFERECANRRIFTVHVYSF